MRSETIKIMAVEEYANDRINRASMLNALSFILEEAEKETNADVWFTTRNIGHGDMIQGVEIANIFALAYMQIELGDHFNPRYILSGMQAATQNEDGYCMSVLTTHDLNSASIPDLCELVHRIRQIPN